MAQTIRLTITPEIEKTLRILRQATMGTLNTTELIKLALGETARKKEIPGLPNKVQDSRNVDPTPEQFDYISARQFYEWAKEDGSLKVDNISPDAKIEKFVPEPYVSDR